MIVVRVMELTFICRSKHVDGVNCGNIVGLVRIAEQIVNFESISFAAVNGTLAGYRYVFTVYFLIKLTNH